MNRVLQMSPAPRRGQEAGGTRTERPRPEGGAEIVILPCIRREPIGATPDRMLSAECR